MDKIEYKNMTINPDMKSCYIDDNEIDLTQNEYNLLNYLLSNKNKIISRVELFQYVWHKNPTGRTIDTTMSRLRKKLGPVGKNIVTKAGFGYGLVD